MPGVKTIESVGELEATVSSEARAAVLYTMSWCPWCTKLKPAFEEAAQTAEFADVAFRVVVLDKHTETDEQWRKPKSSVPQTHLYENGQKIREECGYMERDAFFDCLRGAFSGRGPLERAGEKEETHQCSSNGACCLNRTASGARPVCEGKFEDRRKRAILFHKNKKAFSDLEPNCVFRPTDQDRGILIGRANDEASYFDIILWNAPHEDPGRVYFNLDFMPDPVKKARFESVLFSVTFGQDSEGGKHTPLAIKDLFPTDSDDAASRPLLAPQVDEISSEQAVLDDGSSFVSSLDEDRRSDASVTATVIRGQGLHSPTAVWNITEGKTSSNRLGLDAHYSMYITLPTSSTVWMKFWAKAVLVSGDQVGLGLKHRATLQIGTAEKPYERVLDLSEVLNQT
ncbi:uncharacterized protein PHACADRAFT_264193 [Phanerochaete carnosa HHB-10118-sp]|uniref:Thioredoxin domain-containing protein n=1 Tax=Phanerochaete carnosa (strain HHB-10118-sp) TaxID=650164 RepID=K5VVX4_PHACS|nr:uncharacterized protein PHACADRAFT_264193 [Phanerochaete carnosa HHB-10118-sp]EKM50734.1 hypothetical protein PHACADRAFT_264193 [Phanerochaete carnosa HHB-10118-sp]